MASTERAALAARLAGVRARPLTVGDVFAGGGGASVGARQAGLVTCWAIERDPDIAAVYRTNLGEHVICADALDLDPATLEPVDILWASPPCQDASVARSKRLPPHADAQVGRAVIGYVRALRPKAVILENVPPYRGTPTFRAIVRGLADLGYFIDAQVVNAADAGVPQTRHRLIVRAVLGGLVPPLPAPEPWVGWYAAIEDLLPTLPESKFAPWQLARLPWLTEATLVRGDNPHQLGPLHVGADCPSPVVTAAPRRPRAYLVHNQISQSLDAPMVREGEQPAPIVTTNSGGRVRAFVAHPSADNDRFLIPPDQEPVFTITNTAGTPRAFLQMTSNTQTAHPTGTGVLEPESPSNTVTSGSAAARAWLDAGRVVSMTPRALARFQSFPDWYDLPSSKSLACRVVGNAAPPLLAQRLFEGLAAVLREREEARA